MKLPIISLTALCLLVLGSFFGDLFYTVSPEQLNANAILLNPSFAHPLGTDRLGRDLLARIIDGGKVSLIIAVLSALISSFIGLIIGITAGYFKGKIDGLIVIIIDLFLTFPTFFLLLSLAAYTEATILVLILIISLTSWMSMSRLIRSEVFAINDKPFIKILKIAKIPTLKIMLRYYAPLVAPIFLISFTFAIGGAVLSESGLSFLGLGINPPQMSWGSILSDGKDVMDIAWWSSFFPGLAIFILTYSLVNISDYLQKRFNTKETQI